MICPNCDSSRVIKKGKDRYQLISKQRYKCHDCKHHFYEHNALKYSTYKGNDRTWVITSAVNDININQRFFTTLKNYCNFNNAKLMVIPIKYNVTDVDFPSWDENLLPFITSENQFLTNDLKLLADVNISATAANPLSSIDSMSKGKSLIVASTQLMMKTVSVNHVDKPAIIHTTGCVTESCYNNSKAGEKAKFNHSYSALVIEEDTSINSFHIRVLNSDSTGSFYDLDNFYSHTTISKNNRIPGIVLGDEHVMFIDPDVKKCTFGDNGICESLNPEYLIRHDVLDFYSASHHHRNNTFIKYKKWLTGANNVEQELKLTLNYLIETTAEGSKSIIVDSNHNDHLDQYLNSVDIKHEPWNAKLYHQLMFLKHESIDNNDEKSAFELWVKYHNQDDDLKFISNKESFKLFDIELAFHGHQGISGSRGSTRQFSKLGSKTIIGHQHSPNIYEGTYCVGHSCISKLEYNNGPSSWHQAHCIIQPNGKRQMIFINKGKWRR